MIVCIAEKPSVARDIAHVLGATTSREGYIEGNGYQVTWTFGHLCELKYPEDYTPLWKQWSLGALPMVPPRFGIRLKDDRGVERQFAVIQRLMQAADRIINCGDAGQEGELIQRWVMQKAGARCPVDRLWISSLTEEAIREGFAHLRPQDDYRPLYEAGLCRAIGDWLLGMNATRLYTLKYGRRERGAQPLSIGRVQTPTLALIVRRQQEIENFHPEPYWVLSTLYRDTTFTAETGQPGDDAPDEVAAPSDATKDKAAAALRRGFATEEEGREALRRIEGKPFCVTDVARKNGTEAPPRLFDLTSLQVECNKKLGYSAERTLALIQSLYEKKVTTYPRVDTTYLSDDIYAKCPAILRGLREGYDALLEPLRGRPLRKSKKVFDSSKVTDHHAIIPTGVPPRALTAEEQSVFDLVARRFIAAFYADCRFSSTTVRGEVEGVPFKATGRQIIEPGWRTVFAGTATATDDEADEARQERTLPAFVKGESGPHEPRLAQKMTQPPKPYTEDTLLSAMERAGAEDMPEDAERQGLGTPSTRASILEKLVQMGFVERKGKQLLPTKDGHNLVCVLPDVLTSPQLTAEWETKLTAIAKGEADPEGFMVGIEEMTRSLISRYSQISEDAQKLFQAERVVIGKCPRCGEAVYEGKKNYYCGNRACQFVMWKNDRFFEERGKTFTPKIAAALLKDGKAKVKGLRSMKTGKTYDGTVLLADTGGKYVNYRVEKRS